VQVFYGALVPEHPSEDVNLSSNQCNDTEHGRSN